MVITNILREAKSDRIYIDSIKNKLKITEELFRKILEELENEKLIELYDDELNISLIQKMGLSKAALEAGADFEAVSRSLSWLEFEEFSALLFEENGFRVFRRFRFTAESRRWELDLIAIRNPYIICAECKHWKNGIGNTVARGIIEDHIEKVKKFTSHLNNLAKRIHLEGLKKALIIPITITLSSTPMTMYRIVPSVSILALKSFLSEFDGQIDSITSYKVDLPQPEIKFKQKKLRKEY